MSRSNKRRGYGSHSYVKRGWLTWLKEYGNKALRRKVKEMMNDLLFTDGWDEKEIPGKEKEHLFDRWYYD